MTDKTIAAISTPNGQGGIGIVRISGADARRIADKIFKSKHGLIADAAGYTSLFGGVYDKDEKIDDAVAFVFAAPKSYTGEDVIELSCHGGNTVMQRVLRAVLSAGAVPAQGGEFTRRAFENGKMSLTQAEAVMDIISASGVAAERAAIAAKDGALWRKLCEIKDDIVNLSAWLAAWADYPEEDIPTVEPDALVKRLLNIKSAADRLIDSFDSGKADRDGIDTLILGCPNVGKSTLMNLITGHASSIITDIPGTTRDIISERVNFAGLCLNLFDTAGIHSTNDKIESIGIEMARDKIKSAQLILVVADGSRPLDDDDIRLFEMCSNSPCVAVINKNDLEQKTDLAVIKKYIENTVSISAKNDEDLYELENAIRNCVKIKKINPFDGMLANERQLNCAQNASKALAEAVSAVENGVTLDAVTVLCEEALGHISELSGERVTDTVVDSVFSRFCVGK